MLVGREGANPTEQDLLELASSVDLKRPQRILEEVRLAIGRFAEHADAAGLPAKVRTEVAKALGVDPGGRRARAKVKPPRRR
jgi:hypothetical protein